MTPDMTPARPAPVRMDRSGRIFVCKADSPDSHWYVEVYRAPPQAAAQDGVGNSYYAYAKESDGELWSFPFGQDPQPSDDITFRWDLPHGSWGIYVNDRCWAIFADRSTAPSRPRRGIHRRCGPYATPYTEHDVRFTCALRRGQSKGNKGFVKEE